MASYLNAHHLNTRFKVMICALAIASVTGKTCVLSIVPVVTIIRITQGIRSGGMQFDNFAISGEITAAARSLIDLYSQWAIAVSAICLYFLQNPGCAVIRCMATLAAGKGRSISCQIGEFTRYKKTSCSSRRQTWFLYKINFFRALIRSNPANKKLPPPGRSFLSIKGKA